jgi:hypothetical protein
MCPPPFLPPGNKMRLAAFNNTNAAFLFLPLIAVFEGRIILQHWHLLLSPTYWFLMTIGGVFGFAIGIVTMLQIQVGRLGCCVCITRVQRGCSWGGGEVTACLLCVCLFLAPTRSALLALLTWPCPAPTPLGAYFAGNLRPDTQH